MLNRIQLKLAPIFNSSRLFWFTTYQKRGGGVGAIKHLIFITLSFFLNFSKPELVIGVQHKKLKLCKVRSDGHFCQVWFQWSKWFRRRLDVKSLQTTDSVMTKLTSPFEGELKPLKTV